MPPAAVPPQSALSASALSASTLSETAAPARRLPLAIIGPGALGLHFAARLAAVHPVAVVARDAVGAARLRAGVQVGDTCFHPQVFAADAPPLADWVVVLVKAHDTPGAAAVADRMRARGVLSLQNGLTVDLLRAHCRAPLVDQGITTEGAFREGARVQPSGAGETLVPPGFEAVAQMFTAAGLQARVEADIAAARLAKLLINVAINPLAAVHRVPNGALLEPPLRSRLDALVQEAWPLLRAEGLKLNEEEALARVHAVAQATAANRASMLQDVLAGRRTEIEAITGVLLRMARRRDRQLPQHQAIFDQVRALEPAQPVQ